MPTSKNIITYEVAVDRANEKGVFVAREMLSTLHHAIEHGTPWWQFWKSKQSPVFRFEIIASGGQIRFFISTDARYASFLTGQIYAHYSDIELRECAPILEKTASYRSREIKLAHHSLDPIKLFVNMKDRTEKESVDPLSSLTSAMGKIAKGDSGGFIFDFAPIADSVWRSESKQHIWTSHMIPDFLRLHILHFWSWIGWIFLPISLSLKLISFLVPKEGSEDAHKHEGKEGKEKVESKLESFGYSVKIRAIKNARDPIGDDLILKELSGSMNIFANPSGNSFVMKKMHTLHALPELQKLPKSAMILSVTELAGIIHLPTLYVKTPGIHWVTTRKFEPPHDLPSAEAPNTPIGMANYRGGEVAF